MQLSQEADQKGVGQERDVLDMGIGMKCCGSQDSEVVPRLEVNC